MARFIIIGAGLGGCLLADKLLAHGHHVTMVEHAGGPAYPAPINDTSHPAHTQPHIAAGPGGTTQFWHNGLILPEDSIFAQWPVTKADLQPYIRETFPLLCGVQAAELIPWIKKLKTAYREENMPPHLFGEPLFYPKKRRNVFHSLGLSGRITLVRGTCLPLNDKATGNNPSITVNTPHGQTTLTADAIILAAGGIGTPLLLQKLKLPAARHAGKHYEDHPFGFVGEVFLKNDVYKLWNAAVPGLSGNLRLPMIINTPIGPVAFFLRPAYHLTSQSKRENVTSVLNALRNNPWKISNYFRLFKHTDDIFDILSFKFGISVLTDHFTILMVASHPGSNHVAITRKPNGTIIRDWRLPPDYIKHLRQALNTFIEEIKPNLIKFNRFAHWAPRLSSSAHHSATARMAKSAAEGVCNPNAQVFGAPHLYVADGSLIPASGYANTGLLIGALARRLGDHLHKTYHQSPSKVRKMERTPSVDFVLSGSHGYLGSQLMPLLRQAGFKVMDDTTFQQQSHLRTRWFVHLANIPGNPTANIALTRQHLSKAANRAQGWVQIQTAATLNGNGYYSPTQFNAGFTPQQLGPYTMGKLMQEQALLTAHKQGLINTLHFIYLPIITTAPGPWHSVVQQAKRHGYLMPANTKTTGPDVITIPQIAAWLAQLLPLTGIHRTVLVDPTQRPTWKQLLGPKQVPLKLSPKQQLKELINQAKGYTLKTLWSTDTFTPLYTLLKGEAIPPRQHRQHPVAKTPFRDDAMFTTPSLLERGIPALYLPAPIKLESAKSKPKPKKMQPKPQKPEIETPPETT